MTLRKAVALYKRKGLLDAEEDADAIKELYHRGFTVKYHAGYATVPELERE